MKDYLKYVNMRSFFLKIILPTLLAIGLFLLLIFAFIVPAFEKNMMDSKKEMISELIGQTIQIVSMYDNDAKAGKISIDDAKKQAISRISRLRYGVDNKDYFWITDSHPIMIMHPYRNDLDGQDVSSFKDPDGKFLFVDMVNLAKSQNQGYVDYMWQWMDDSLRIVPKISYIRLYKPWGWIIGTGVYVEDIKNEIHTIGQTLVIVTFGISLLLGIILTFIAQVNLKAEISRKLAEESLKISNEKYKALVEVSTEGTAMFLENESIFANDKFRDIFDSSQIQSLGNDLKAIISEDRVEDLDAIYQFYVSMDNFLQIETVLKGREGNHLTAIISLSKITLYDKQGFIIVIKDLDIKDSDEVKGKRSAKLLSLFDSLSSGIFECTAGKSPKFIDVNHHLAELFGYDSKEALMKVSLNELIDDDDDLKNLLREIKHHHSVKDFHISFRKKDGQRGILSISAKGEFDSEGELINIFGIMTDITSRKAIEQMKDGVLNEIKDSTAFLNQPVSNLTKSVVSCDISVSAREAVELMNGYQSGHIFIKSGTGEYIGLLTPQIFQSRVFPFADVLNYPINQLMQSPLIRIDENEALTEAIIQMQVHNTGHLAVQDRNRNIIGVLRKEDITNEIIGHSINQVNRIENAISAAELKSIFMSLPLYINNLIKSGARTDIVTKSITEVSDAITRKLIEIITKDIGAPPVPYAFIALGSEGRREQTLLTDQDNAIIYSNVDEDKKEIAEEYFKELGNKLCDWLDFVGYNFCEGNVMAKNPKWNQPIKVWKIYFNQWISTPEPQNLLDASIFFDFRLISGEDELIEELRDSINHSLAQNPAFFQQMARICISYKTPLGMFGKIHTESSEEHSNAVNIKNPIRVIVSLLRIYSMKNRLNETNSLKRLSLLKDLNVFSSTFARDIGYAFDYMMLLQFKTQANSYSMNKPIDNFVNLSDLSSIEINILKNVFGQIGEFQSKIKNDFGISE